MKLNIRKGMRRVSMFLLAALLLIINNVSTAQNSPASESDLKQQAQKYFDDEDYADAYPAYSQLLSLYPEDPTYNYRVGACMLFINEDKEKPIDYLQLALKKHCTDNLVYYYLGRAYHLNYKFDDAIRFYQHFQQVASSSLQKKYPVAHLIDMCNDGKTLLKNMHELDVLDKKQLNMADYFQAYDLSANGGSVLVEPDDFKTKLDKKKNASSIIYLSADKNRVFFSSYGDDDKNGKDIYEVRRLPTGGFSKPVNLGTIINSPYDEDFPFYDEPTHTLYFSSKGHNSMGGYDVFKSIYNEGLDTWSSPVNMDFPINTPDDDILFIADTLNQTAYFASTRSSPKGSIDIYKIKLEPHAPEYVLLRGTTYADDHKNIGVAKITVKNVKNDQVVGVYNSSPDNGSYLMSLPNASTFVYTVESTGHQTQSKPVILPLEKTMITLKQEISYEAGTDKLIITNNFQAAGSDSDYLLALNYIKQKALMDVHIDSSKLAAENTTQPVATSNNNTSNNTNVAANNNPDNSNTSANNPSNNNSVAANSANNNPVNSNTSANNPSNNNSVVANSANNNSNNSNATTSANKIDSAQTVAANNNNNVTANSANNPVNSNASTNTGNPDSLNSGNGNISNAQLVQIAQSDAKQDRESAKNMKEDASKATEYANDKLQQAQELNQEAQQITDNANNLTDPAQKKDSLDKAATLKQQAQDLSKKAIEAFELAAQEQSQANAKQKQADQATTYSAQLDSAQKATNSKQAIAQLQDQHDKLIKQQQTTPTASTTAGDLIRQQAENTKLDSVEVVHHNEDLKKEIPQLQQQSQDYIAQAQKTDNAQEKLALLQQAKDLSESKKQKEKELKDNAKLPQQLHEQYLGQIAEAQTADSISKAGSQASTSEQAASDTNLKHEIASYTPSANNNTVKNSSQNSPTNSQQVAANTSENNQNNNPANNSAQNNPTNSQQVAANNSENNQNNNPANNASQNNPTNSQQVAANTSENNQNNNPANNASQNNPTNSQQVAANTSENNQNNNPANNASQNNPTNSQQVAANTSENNQNNNPANNASQNNPTNSQQVAANTSENNQNNNLANNVSQNNPTNSQQVAANTSENNQNNNPANNSSQNNSNQPTVNQPQVSKTSSIYNSTPLTQTNTTTGVSSVVPTTSVQYSNPAASEASKSANSLIADADILTSAANDTRKQARETTDHTQAVMLSHKADSLDKVAAREKSQGAEYAANADITQFQANKEELTSWQNKLKGNGSDKVTTANLLLQDANFYYKKSLAEKQKADSTNKSYLKETYLDQARQDVGTALIKQQTAENIYLNVDPNITSETVSPTVATSNANNAITANNSTSNNLNTANNTQQAQNNPANNSPQNNQTNSQQVAANNTSESNQNNNPANNNTTSANNNQSNTTNLTANNNNSAANNNASQNNPSNNSTTASVNKIDTTKSNANNQSNTTVANNNNQNNTTASIQAANKIDSMLSAPNNNNNTAVNNNASQNNPSNNNTVASTNKVDSTQTNPQNNQSNFTNLTPANNNTAVNNNTSQNNQSNTSNPTVANNNNPAVNNNTSQNNSSTNNVTASTNKIDSSKGAANNQSTTTNPTVANNNNTAANNNASQNNPSNNNTVASTNKTDSNQSNTSNPTVANNNNTSVNNNASQNNPSNNNTVAANNKIDSNKTVAANNQPNTTNPTVANNTNTENNSTNSATTTSVQTANKIDSALSANNTNNSSNTSNPVTANNNTSNPSNTQASETNNTANNNTSSTVTTTLNVDAFEELPTSPYSAAKPIPINPPLPEGLVFKVQIGAFRNPIPQSLFKGINPITGERTPKGLTRYMAGIFKEIGGAKSAQTKIHALGYRDAFIVAFLNGKRIPLYQATGTQPNNVANTNVTNVQPVNNNPTVTTTQNQETVTAANNNTTNTTAASTEVKDVKGLFYSVQVGAFQHPVPPAKLYNLSPLFSYNASNGYIRYNCGIYSSVPKASDAKQNIILKTPIKDAFVVAYYNGDRVGLAQAGQLLSNGSAAISQNPNLDIIPGGGTNNGITQQPNNAVTNPTPNNTTNPNISPAVTDTTGGGKVTFCVQVGAYSGQIPIDMANKLLKISSQGIHTHKEDNGITAYTVGEYPNYTSADLLKQELIKGGYSESFIVAYYQGKKISLQQAQTLINK